MYIFWYPAIVYCDITYKSTSKGTLILDSPCWMKTVFQPKHFAKHISEG